MNSFHSYISDPTMAIFSYLQTTAYLILSLVYALMTFLIWGPQHASWDLKTHILVSATHAYSTFSNHFSNSPPKSIVDPIISEEAYSTAIKAQKAVNYLTSLGSPPMGYSAPCYIPVWKRNLPGLLSESDAQESGKRVLKAEWQSSFYHQAHPEELTDRIMLYFHGGAYTLGSPASHSPMTTILAKVGNCRVLSVDYRLAPQCVFPAATFDAMTAYLYLTSELGISPQNIILAGDSAGGGIVLSLLTYLRDENFALPSGSVLLSPYGDLTASFGSWETNIGSDYLPLSAVASQTTLFLGPLTNNHEKSGSPTVLSPYVSPALSGEFSSFPPTLIITGTCDSLQDDSVVLASKMTRDGVDVTLEVYEEGVHVFMAIDIFGPCSRAAFSSIEKWTTCIGAKNFSGPLSELGNRAMRSIDTLLQKAYNSLTSSAKQNAMVEFPAIMSSSLWINTIAPLPTVQVRAGVVEEVKLVATEAAKCTTRKTGVPPKFHAYQRVNVVRCG